MAMTMPTVIIQKHSCFLGVLDKNFAIDPQICKKKTKSTELATLSRKPHQQIRLTCYEKSSETSSCSRKPHKNGGFQAFDQQKLPKINDTPCMAADARATLLLLLVVVVVVLLVLLLLLLSLSLLLVAVAVAFLLLLVLLVLLVLLLLYLLLLSLLLLLLSSSWLLL